MIDDKERCELVVASDPVNITAMRVMFKGVDYNWDKELPKGYVNSEIALPLRNIPTATKGSFIENLAGIKFGRFEVIGLYAEYRRQLNGSRGKGRTGINMARINLWVVRCKCGKYEVRRRKSVLNPNNSQDACFFCRHEIRMKGRSL